MTRYLTNGKRLGCLIVAVTFGALSPATLGAVVPVIQSPPALVAVTINASAGDQFDPHVSGDWAAYTDDVGIRYYNFATNTDAAIPMGASARGLLSDISGSKIVYSRVTVGVGTSVMVFDAATAAAPIEVDPAPGTTRLGAAIGGSTIAYIDFGLEANGELVISDLATAASTRITNDTATDNNPSVSPDGNVVVWEHCETTLTNCDIYQAVKSGAGWTTSVVSDAFGQEGNPETNGALVVYDAQRANTYHVYWRPVGGGVENQLEMAGAQANPSIAGQYIAFESRTSILESADIFVYDIANNRLFQITNTPLVNEQLNDITVLSDGRLRVVWASDEDGTDSRNIKAATFAVPGAPARSIIFTSTRDGNFEIYAMHADGTTQTRLTNNPRTDLFPAQSPDATKIAFSSDRAAFLNFDLYSMNGDGTTVTRLTTNAGVAGRPAWSPNGSRIAFTSLRNGNADIYVMNADGTNLTRLTTNGAADLDPAWSPDGARIAFTSTRTGNGDIYVMNADGTGQTRVTTASAVEGLAAWSPSGSSIALTSNRDSIFTTDIYVMHSDGTGSVRLTTDPGIDAEAAWSADGAHIAFSRNGDVYVMNADGSGQTRLTKNSGINTSPSW